MHTVCLALWIYVASEIIEIKVMYFHIIHLLCALLGAGG